jgi:hypothetical protein
MHEQFCRIGWISTESRNRLLSCMVFYTCKLNVMVINNIKQSISSNFVYSRTFWCWSSSVLFLSHIFNSSSKFWFWSFQIWYRNISILKYRLAKFSYWMNKSMFRHFHLFSLNIVDRGGKTKERHKIFLIKNFFSPHSECPSFFNFTQRFDRFFSNGSSVKILFWVGVVFSIFPWVIVDIRSSKKPEIILKQFWQNATFFWLS